MKTKSTGLSVGTDWPTVKLGSICDITRGASPRPILDWISSEGTPWVKISDATKESGRFISSTKEFIRDEGRTKSVVVKPGDLIVSNSATPGLPKFLKIEACVHDGWLVLRNFRDLLPEFLYYRLLLDRKLLVSQGSGSVFTNLKTDILKNHEFPLPVLREQKWIVDLLNEIEDLIQLNEVIIADLENYVQTIFRSWFIKFEPVHAKMRNEKPIGMDSATAALFPESFVDSDLGSIPAGWSSNIADNIFNISIGRTPPRKESEWFCGSDSGLPWVSIRDMGKFRLYSNSVSEGLTDVAVAKFRVPIVPMGTVIMSFKLTVGKLAITDRPLVTNEAIAHFVTGDKSPLTNYFTYLWLSNFDMNSLDSTSSIGTATNSSAIKKIKFLVPDIQAVSLFSAICAPVFEQINNLSEVNNNLSLVRDSLLPRLMSGELRYSETKLEN